MFDDHWGLEAFFHDLYNYVSEVVNLKTFRNMDDETRQKLISKITILACKEFSPRKNFDIGRDEIREYVGRIIVAELNREEAAQDEFDQRHSAPR